MLDISRKQNLGDMVCNKMRTEKEIREMLALVDRDDELHTIILKDVGIEEIKTAKDILKWVLKED